MTYAAAAAAQFTGTVSLVSDYRFRGVSLSQEKPAAQAGIGYDHPSGWYAGVFGSTVQLADASATTVQSVAYLGVVRSIGESLHWDVGAVYTAFSATRDYNYGEIQTAIASATYSARVHYSPHYFGLAHGSFYAEINGTQALGNGFSLLGHVGVLVPLGHANYRRPNTAQDPVDARVGLGIELSRFNIELAWVGTNSNGGVYPVRTTRHRTSGLASVTWAF